MKKLSSSQIQRFQQAVIEWYHQHGRKDLPWQLASSPYHVWLSEVMLQQTQVETVIPYFNKFIQHFPDINALANADIDHVMHLWSGLGYYARARNLHKTANTIVDDFSSKIPSNAEQLQQLPGIGRSTAGAIESLAFNQPAAILDGNVKRVLTRYYRIKGWPGTSAIMKQLWTISETLTPSQQTAEFNQAMMDIGSLICRRSKPECGVCPLEQSCAANKLAEVNLYPGKKPFKEKPLKQQHFYLIKNSETHILIYQRPPVGIWGGLWCLPDASHISEGSIETDSVEEISSFIHQFTHFTLKAKVSSVRMNSKHEIMDGRNWSWYDPINPAKIGIPAPIISFLQINSAT